MKIEIIDFESLEYPEKLRKIKNPPKKIFYQGNVSLLNEESIAIVGSRDLSDYGRMVGKDIIKEIALRDITVVSGMAIGADRLAHEETLNVGGKTIAVMGTSFDHIYPVENVDIYKRILDEGGLVITEYGNETEYLPTNFPKRNRIISGLAEAVFVIEAKFRSGTSTTAKHAWEQGKNVYALPGRLDCINGVGVNILIQKGAKLVTCAEDILDDFQKFKNKKKKLIIQNNRVKKEYRRIYDVLSDNPISVEEIALKTNNTVLCTLKLLSLMEFDDLIKQVIGVRLCQKKSIKMILKL